MAVHPDSVIDLWVNTLDPEFYVSLTNKEEWSYTSGGSVVDWQPLFSSLMAAINNWKTANRNGEELFVQVFQYRFVPLQFASLPLPAPYNDAYVDARYQLNMGNFISDTLSRPVNYYNDYNSLTSTSAKMDASILQVNSFASTEASALSTITNGIGKNVSRLVYLSLFSTAAQSPTNKEQEVTYLFIDKRWKSYNAGLELGLIVPPYVP